MLRDVYTHGHQPVVVDQHARRTVETSAAFLLPHLNDSMRILDVGCGPGQFLESIRKNVLKVVGVEKNHEERAFVNDHLKIPCYEDYETIEEGFDVIVLNQILEHVYNPSFFLRKLRSILSENGVFVIEVPSASNPLVSLYNNRSFTNFWFQEPHLWYFNQKTLQFTLEKALGDTQYVGDMQMPGMLHARVLWAGVPHATIRGVDVSQARAMPGVCAVVTAVDLPGVNRYGLAVQDLSLIHI